MLINNAKFVIFSKPRGISSVGRAIGSQSIGQGFESPILQNCTFLVYQSLPGPG